MKRYRLAVVLITALLTVGLVTGWAFTQDRFRGDPEYLEPKDRDSWQMPERVMDVIGVRSGMLIGEVGAGGGYFTVKLAARVGPDGHVYANDINRDYLDYLEERCEKGGIHNVTTILGEENDPLLPRGRLDLVIMVNVYHELGEPVTLMRAVMPSLKPEGVLVIVEYDESKRGSKHSSNPEKALSKIQEAGYEFVRREDFLPRQFILIFRPGHR